MNQRRNLPLLHGLAADLLLVLQAALRLHLGEVLDEATRGRLLRVAERVHATIWKERS